MGKKSLFLQHETYDAGDILLSPKQSLKHAYIVERGLIEITDIKSGTVQNFSEGDVFGHQVFLGLKPKGWEIKILEDTMLFQITPEVFTGRMQSQDPLLSLVMSLYADHYKGSALPSLSPLDSLIPAYQEQTRTVLEELRMELDLRRALRENQFEPWLQPIVQIPSGRIIGFEALIRWRHPEKGLIFPDQFIPIAERTNVIQEIDQCMLEAACEVIPKLNAALKIKNADDIYVSVNLSGVNFSDETVVSRVRKTIKNSGINPSSIKLEITESSLIENESKVENILGKLKNIGVGISLDDFGTGYSSLGYLHRFAIDGLKIDRSFVRQLSADPRSKDIIKAIMGLADNFDLNVVAEGIESDKEMKMLANMGCSQGQGYHFSKPIPVEEALRAVQSMH